MSNIQLFLFILLLLIATYTDIEKREIPDTVCIGIGMLSLFDFHLLGILAATPFAICTMRNSRSFGGGDVKLTAAVGLLLGFWKTIYGIIIALSLAIVMYVANAILGKKQEGKLTPLPLVPYLTIGFLITLIY